MKFFKCLWQRKVLFILLILAGLGIGALSIYSFYNPSHEMYEITFTYETTDYDLSDLNKTSYVKNVKSEIQEIRKEGEYIILNNYYFLEDNGYSAENYKDSKGYNHFIIKDSSDNTLYDEYGIFDKIDDGYVIISDWYYYTNGYSVSYKSGEVTLKDSDNNEIVLKAKWNKEFNYSYSSFSYIKSKKIASTTKYKINDDGSITLSCQQRYLNSWQQARRFMMRMANNLNSEAAYFKRGESSVKSDTKALLEESVISKTGGTSVLKYSLIGAATGFALGLVVIGSLVIIKKEEAIDNLPYDNERIYKYPFKLSYWKNSLKELKTIKRLTFLAMLFAMMQVVRLISLPSGFGNLGISLSMFFFAIIGMLYGPSIGLMIGMVSDIFGYFVFPDGYPFHIGYTIQAGLTGFMYGICFYRTKVDFSKALFARLVINLFLNAVLGSLFWGDVADLSKEATKTYFLTLSLPKNVAYLIPQSLLLYLFIKALAPALKSLGLIEPEVADDIIKLRNDIKLNNNIEEQTN